MNQVVMLYIFDSLKETSSRELFVCESVHICCSVCLFIRAKTTRQKENGFAFFVVHSLFTAHRLQNHSNSGKYYSKPKE